MTATMTGNILVGVSRVCTASKTNYIKNIKHIDLYPYLSKISLLEISQKRGCQSLSIFQKGNDLKTTKNKKSPISNTRRQYIWKLIGRILVFIGCIFLCIYYPQSFKIIDNGKFFRSFSVLHILWVIWMLDMFLQIVPVKNKVALGSQKLFANRFKPIREKINSRALKDFVLSTTKSAYKIFILWTLLIIVIGVFYHRGIIDKMGIFMTTVFFYVCDLICVLIWCPFRLIMKNKCCTTCRIFNWDHLMMFTPFIYIGGFYATSLVIVAFLAWLVWEMCVMLYPERFWEKTNVSLKCSECTDKLCIQYCQKLR